MTRMTSAAIEKRITEIKLELQGIGPMRPGSLSEQYTVCGKAGCRCADPKHPRKHGPYYQLSFVHQSSVVTIREMGKPICFRGLRRGMVSRPV